MKEYMTKAGMTIPLIAVGGSRIRSNWLNVLLVRMLGSQVRCLMSVSSSVSLMFIGFSNVKGAKIGKKKQTN